MHRITNTGRVNLGHLFWLRSLAIIGQLVTIAVVQTFYGAHLPLAAMLTVVGLEVLFNAMTWIRVAGGALKRIWNCSGNYGSILARCRHCCFYPAGRPTRLSRYTC